MDVSKMIQQVLEPIKEFLTAVVPIALPGDLELPVWLWGIIVGGVAGSIGWIVHLARK